ncbi:hypothetical protein [Aggregatilinea lenta]|uniref:hypothetical protein n=1 Tax=Aggregatilinea lenta TaxID=913108 RepID=UPI000E5AF8C5|nr:hypothetical protein [Aggregatilinea lenta]
MQQRHISFVAALSIAVAALLMVSSIDAQQDTPLQGSVYHCLQSQSYGTEVARTADYWEFVGHDERIRDIYFVERFQDFPICGRVVIDTGRAVAYYQEGNTVSYLDLNEFDSPAPCMKMLAENVPQGQESNGFVHTMYMTEQIAQELEVNIN